MERNIDELKEFCTEYFKTFGTSSGLNLKLSHNEKVKLLDNLECGNLKECVHILVYGYIGICKICQKRTEYIDITKLYRPYCSHKCSTMDTEVSHLRGIKSHKTKMENGTIVKIPRKMIPCKECGCEVWVSTNTIKKHLGFCALHKKSCIVCGDRHSNSGGCCSKKCVNKMKRDTNMKNSGVAHNLLIGGVRRNQIEFYLKKGLSYEESNKLLHDFQISNNKISNFIDNKIKTLLTKNNIDDVSKYFFVLADKINRFTYKEFHKPYDLISLICNESIIKLYGHKLIYDKLCRIDKKIFKYKIVKFKKTKFGNIISFTNDGDMLRSRLEYDFYRLLEINNIKKYKVDKKYPNSNFRYDFYLEEYDIYVEITGMLSFPKYREKIEMKKRMFPNVQCLGTFQDMLCFIQKLKSNENKIN
jgi:hypothetical protein